jgi:hypothetical protein
MCVVQSCKVCGCVCVCVCVCVCSFSHLNGVHACARERCWVVGLVVERVDVAIEEATDVRNPPLVVLIKPRVHAPVDTAEQERASEMNEEQRRWHVGWNRQKCRHSACWGAKLFHVRSIGCAGNGQMDGAKQVERV